MPLNSTRQVSLRSPKLQIDRTSHSPLLTTAPIRNKHTQCLLYAPQSTSPDLPPSSSPIQRDISRPCAPQRLAHSPPLTRQTSQSIPRPTQPRTKATTIRRPDGCLASHRARSTRTRGGRMRGCMGFGAVCSWGSWLMLTSLILRKYHAILSPLYLWSHNLGGKGRGVFG